MKNVLNISLIALLLVSCTKPSEPPSDLTLGGGVFIINEGQFTAGNGSLSFYSYDSMKIYNGVFESTNGRPLGDVPNSIFIHSDNAYLIVNNSGKIEVIDNSTFESKTIISGLISPRNMAAVDDNKAYLTSMYSDSLVIIDLQNNSKLGYINLHNSSEAIAVSGNFAYVSSWINGNKILIINTLNDQVVDSVVVGPEPESMAIDKYGRLWVLCGGGWQRENYAELDVINTANNQLENEFIFPSLQSYPSCLKIDDSGQNIFFLDKGVKQMDVSSSALPSTTLIPESGSSFYKIAVNPANNDIFVTDALDYAQNGYVMIYKSDGSFDSKYRAGLIPGSMTFKLTLQ